MSHTVIAEGMEQVRGVQLLATRAALKLEIETGMKFSNKGSLVTAAIKHGYVAEGTRSKRKAYAQLDALVVSALGMESRPLRATA